VYLLDSGDGLGGLGVSVSRSGFVEDGFEQTVLAPPSSRRSPRIASFDGGYAVVWLEGGRIPDSLMQLSLDEGGQPLGEARELARVDAAQFSLASTAGTLSIAATERVDNEWFVSFRRVTTSGLSKNMILDSCSHQSFAPAVVWDGNAFDVVYACAKTDEAGAPLQLARITEAGELLGPSRALDIQVQSGSCPSLAATLDRGTISMVYAAQTEPAGAYFVRVDPEGETPLEPVSLVSSLPVGQMRLAPAPTGYEVVSTSCAPGVSVGVAVTSCALSGSGVPTAACRRMPTSSYIPRATALVSGPQGATFLYDEYLLNGHPGVFAVQLPSDPLGPFLATSVVSPVGELSHKSLFCSKDACRLQSFRSEGRFRANPARAIEYTELGVVETTHVDLKSGGVESHIHSRLLPVRVAKVVQAEPDGLLALLDTHAFDVPAREPELVALNRSLSELWSLPLPQGELFAEAGGVRSFTSNLPDDVFMKDGSSGETQHRNRRPIYDLSFCAGAYYDIDAERQTLYRLEPSDGAQWRPFASVPAGRGWLHCTDGMVCALTNDMVTRKWWCWDHSGRALPGATFPDKDSRFFTHFDFPIGPDLAIASIASEARGRFTLTRLRPNGSTIEYELSAPAGMEFGSWVATGNAHHAYLAWNDRTNGDTYLSDWELR
jgi:hypothetical protein